MYSKNLLVRMNGGGSLTRDSYQYDESCISSDGGYLHIDPINYYDLDDPDALKPYECLICENFLCDNIETIELHVRGHAPFICYQCNRVYANFKSKETCQLLHSIDFSFLRKFVDTSSCHHANEKGDNHQIISRGKVHDQLELGNNTKRRKEGHMK